MARILPLLVALAALTVAGPQRLYVGPSDLDQPLQWAEAHLFDGMFVLCRGYFYANRYEPNGSGWNTDYPGADQNLLVRFSELTKAKVRFRDGRPTFVVVKLSDPLLRRCPVLLMEDVGVVALLPQEIEGLRAYLVAGGFLWVDDFWGPDAWRQWLRELRLVLPSAEPVRLDAMHPIFHTLYDLNGIWQQPAIGLWYSTDCHEEAPAWARCPMQTSERGPASATPAASAVLDAAGRVIVFMTHNTDIADGWEEEAQNMNPAYAYEFSSRSYALGVNVLIYALAH